MITAAAQVQDDEQIAQHCVGITPAGRSHGKQGHHVFAGISAQSAGAQGLCMHIVAIPAGGRARAHLHEDHESAVYQAEGATVCWYGDRLEHHVMVRQGDMVYIPAGVPHLPVNASEHEPAVCVVARTDADEQESVVLLPELEMLRHTGSQGGVVVELDSVRR